MIHTNVIQQLELRGLIAQITDKKDLITKLTTGPITLYCGFDPTADSLHLGHLVLLLCLKRFQLAGHKPVVLVGQATSLIGDPSFKTAERKLNTIDISEEWAGKIQHQISSFLDFDCGKNSAITANNYDWFSSMNTLMFLRDIGKYFSINKMINKDAINQRLNRNSNGISFTEFSYNLLQSYDFAYLNKRYNVILQIGGSDQWGNITSGVNLTRRLHHNIVYGLTVPLITKVDGTKFGKTEDDTVWLDPCKTSPYKFYQFWINIADSNVYLFLKFFTFIENNVIESLKKEDHLNNGKIPRAKYLLAEEVTRIVHGEQGLIAAKRITNSLFSEILTDLTQNDLTQLAQDGIPTINVKHGITLQEALFISDLVQSISQARNLISSRAVSINSKKQTSLNYVFNDTDRLYGQYTLLRRGKKHYCLLNWQH